VSPFCDGLPPATQRIDRGRQLPPRHGLRSRSYR
jgi:hypothetical protein